LFGPERLGSNRSKGATHRQDCVSQYAAADAEAAPVPHLVGVANRGGDELGPRDRGHDLADIGAEEADARLADEVPVLQPLGHALFANVKRLAGADHRQRPQARSK
jgi:hypothetical protein